MEDHNTMQKVIKSILLFLCVLVVGIAGYMWIEGWNLLDSIFMTIITLGTVGYGETHDLSSAGRIFTIFLIVFGLGSAASVLNSFATVLIDNKLDRLLGRKNMNTELKKLNNHVILCGFGQIGMIIAIKLQEQNIPFVVIESEKEEWEKATQLGFVALCGEVTADAMLLNAGIKKAKTLVICVSDLTVNLTLSLAAKEINPQIEVIAQGVDRSLEPRITRAGADVVVYPIALGGEQISEIIVNGFWGDERKTSELSQPVEGYYLKLYKHFSNEQTSIQKVLNNENGVRVIAYKNKEGKTIDNPDETLHISYEESLIILMNENETYQGDRQSKTYVEVVWSDDYSVGDAMIDEEHLRLIQLINRFNLSIEKGESNKIVADTFDRLIAYTLEHFKNEEERLRKCHYPELDEHILEHKKLVQTLMDLNKEKRYIFPESISSFLNSWLIDHILLCDKQYIKYIH